MNDQPHTHAPYPARTRPRKKRPDAAKSGREPAFWSQTKTVFLSDADTSASIEYGVNEHGNIQIVVAPVLMRLVADMYTETLSRDAVAARSAMISVLHECGAMSDRQLEKKRKEAERKAKR